MSEYYDRQGNPLTLLEWGAMLERREREYKVVAQDTINGRWFVSTVWLGYNHQYGDGPPLIFETREGHALALVARGAPARPDGRDC